MPSRFPHLNHLSRRLAYGSAAVWLVFATACSPSTPPAATPPPTTAPATAAASPAAAPAASPAASPALPSPVASPSAVASPAAALPATAPPPNPTSRGTLRYGVSTFVWGHPQTRDRDLATAANAGFEWHKSLFQWRAMEPQRGQYDWREADRVVQASNSAGVKVLARLDFQPAWARKDGRTNNGAPDDPQDFARFVTALVNRYQAGSPYGEVHAIEVWNEPNLQREWGRPITRTTAREYVELLSAAYKAAKAVNPNIVVVTAGLSPTGWDDETARPDDTFLQWLFDAGMAGNYDALGVHANAQAPDPLAAPGSLAQFAHPSFYFRRVEQLRKIQETNGDANKPIWVLEFGWTSDQVHKDYSWYAVSEQKKGDNLVTAMRYAAESWQPWIGPMFVWTLPDPSWTEQREEYWWAIANADGTPRPALERIRAAHASGELP